MRSSKNFFAAKLDVQKGSRESTYDYLYFHLKLVSWVALWAAATQLRASKAPQVKRATLTTKRLVRSLPPGDRLQRSI